VITPRQTPVDLAVAEPAWQGSGMRKLDFGRPELDGFRGIAAAFVVIFHAYQFNRRPDWSWPFQDTVWHRLMMSATPQ